MLRPHYQTIQSPGQCTAGRGLWDTRVWDLGDPLKDLWPAVPRAAFTLLWQEESRDFALDLPRSQRRKRARFQASFRAGCENPENTEPWSGAVRPWTDTGETSLRGAHSSQSSEWVIPGPLRCPHGPKAMGSGHPGCMEAAGPVESMFWKNHSRGCGMGPVSEGGSVLCMCAPTAVPGGRPAHCAFTERGLPGHCGNRHSPNKSKCRLFAQSLPWGGHPR